jgi:hypothetical protein
LTAKALAPVAACRLLQQLLITFGRAHGAIQLINQSIFALIQLLSAEKPNTK